MTYYAHTSGTEESAWQRLSEHLLRVATEARSRAERIPAGPFDLATAAYLAGLWHDAGKYRPGFQKRLRGILVSPDEANHSQAGAARAFDGSRPDLALAIAGHHGGLPDFEELRELCASRSGRAALDEICAVAASDCPLLEHPIPPSVGPVVDPLLCDLAVRLIFSCLVDADWADTERWERKARGLSSETGPPPLDPRLRLDRVLKYVAGKSVSCADPRIREIREGILQAALAAADAPPGLFSLSVPTGGGKTLSGLAFALRHAECHGLERIIYVAPYLTILEQNAREIRAALGIQDDGAVFEHFSLASVEEDDDGTHRAAHRSRDEEAQTAARRRRAENWSAPVIVTTNVQFFESLFCNRPARCRKLHNLARSVIILDECQTLPPDVISPTVSMLGDLSRTAGCSILLATATQPAWPTLKDVREVIPKDLDLPRRLRRVVLDWPADEHERWSWDQVADRMLATSATAPQALCVVNAKASARAVFAALRDRRAPGMHHLSTAMCPSHRLRVLDEVRADLRAGRPCLLVSTQLVEAGVDVDFPVVLRELGPLESIIQAAGRCNREGRLNGPNGEPGGRAIVFRSIDGRTPQDRWYQAAIAKVEQLLRAGERPSLDDPEAVRRYFAALYDPYRGRDPLDACDIQRLRRDGKFRTVWEGDGSPSSTRGRYRIVDSPTVPLVAANWEAGHDVIECLLREVRQAPSRGVYQRLSRYQVNVYRHELQKLQDSGRLVETDERTGIRIWRGAYDEALGLVPDLPDIDLVV